MPWHVRFSTGSKVLDNNTHIKWNGCTVYTVNTPHMHLQSTIYNLQCIVQSVMWLSLTFTLAWVKSVILFFCWEAWIGNISCMRTQWQCVWCRVCSLQYTYCNSQQQGVTENWEFWGWRTEQVVCKKKKKTKKKKEKEQEKMEKEWNHVQ